MTSQQIEIAAGKNVASSKKLSNNKKNEAATNSTQVQGGSPASTNKTNLGTSKSKAANTASVNTPKNGTDPKVTTSNSNGTNDEKTSKNATSTAAAGDNNSHVNSSVKNDTEEANFSIVDHEDSSKNYSSHETLAGMSVAYITISVLKRQGIYIQYTSSITGIYVSDINHQQEKSKGPSSGWVYYVNGKKARVGSSGYKLNAGDRVEWQFWADAINN